MAEFRVYDLLKITEGQSPAFDRALPPWASRMLACAPYAVVRRGREAAGIPVGLRGAEKSQRFACALRPEAAADVRTPEELLRALLCGEAGSAVWAAAFRPLRAELLEPGRAFSGVRSLGVTGSLSFELASGCAVTTETSDIDLLVRVDTAQFDRAAAQDLLGAFRRLGRRVDAVLETPNGWTALAEYASDAPEFLQKTRDGCRLTDRL